MYVPKALIIDDRDSFCDGWGSNSNNYGGGGGTTSAEVSAARKIIVSLFDAPNHDAMFAGRGLDNRLFLLIILW